MFFPIAPEDGKKLGEQSSRTGSGLPITVQSMILCFTSSLILEGVRLKICIGNDAIQQFVWVGFILCQRFWNRF